MTRGDLNLFFEIPPNIFAGLVINNVFRTDLNKVAVKDTVKIFYKDSQPTKISFVYNLKKHAIDITVTSKGLCAHSCDNVEIDEKSLKKVLALLERSVGSLNIKSGVEGIDAPEGIKGLELNALLVGEFQEALSKKFEKVGLKASIVTIRVAVSDKEKDVGGFDLFHRNKESLNEKYLQYIASDSKVLERVRELLSEVKK